MAYTVMSRFIKRVPLEPGKCVIHSVTPWGLVDQPLNVALSLVGAVVDVSPTICHILYLVVSIIGTPVPPLRSYVIVNVPVDACAVCGATGIRHVCIARQIRIAIILFVI
jgi:hypothetical protein